MSEVQARQAIAKLCTTYTTCADRGKADEVAAVFTEDASFEIPAGTLHGRDTIRRYFVDLIESAILAPGKQSPARHHLTTSHITMEESTRASGRTYFIVVRDGAIIQTGLYFDTFILTGGRWLIGHRCVKMEFDLLASDEQR